MATTRKLVTTIVSSADKIQLNSRRSGKSSGICQNGLAFKNGHIKRDEIIGPKRTKRALVIEKDKSASPRCVKVLRRSHVIGFSYRDDHCEKPSTGKFCLPSVKANKTI